MPSMPPLLRVSLGCLLLVEGAGEEWGEPSKLSWSS